MRSVINVSQAPKAVGPYSHAVKVGNLLFLSGQVGLDPATNALVPGGIREQTRQVMENLSVIIRESGFSLGDVVKTTCYLSDMNNFQAFNEEYAKYFGTILPARETIEISRLPKDGLVEVSLICCAG